MINWELFAPRNLVVISLLACLGVFILNHFSQSTSEDK